MSLKVIEMSIDLKVLNVLKDDETKEIIELRLGFAAIGIVTFCHGGTTGLSFSN
jgi:transcriptional regulator of met regulon